MRRIAALAAVATGLALASPAASRADADTSPLLGPSPPGANDARPCVGEQEAEALITFLLPTAIEEAQSQCAGALAPGAVLRTDGGRIADALRADADRAWPRVGATVRRMIGGMAQFLGPDALRQLTRDGFREQLARRIAPDDCRRADRLVAILSPLPAASLAQLGVFYLSTRQAQQDGLLRLPVRLCAAPATRPRP